MDQVLSELNGVSQASKRPRDLRRVGSHPDHWYPLAWSHELKRGKTLAVRFAGEPIVLARPESGPVFALEDRCAHRQVPLSKGVVQGDAIRCCYHGWTYDGAGRCVDVPYLGKDKLPNGVRSYPCREAEGLILVFPGDPARADEVSLPGLGSVADPRYKTRRFGRVVACHYSFMHENLMDMNHQFLHRKQMGQIRPRFLGQSQGEDWIEARYTFARTAGKQPLGEALVFGQRRSASASTAERDVMTIRTEYPYQTLRIRTKDDTPVMDLWIVYVPLDQAQRTHPHVWPAVGAAAEDPRPSRRRVAAAGDVHGAHLQGGPGDRRDGAGGARRAGRRLEPGGVSTDPQPARGADRLRDSGGCAACAWPCEGIGGGAGLEPV